MRIAGLQVDTATTVAAIRGVCALAVAASVGINTAHAKGNPLTQTSPEEKISSTIPQVNADSNSAQIDPESTRRSDAQVKEERKEKSLRSRRLVVLDFLEQHFPELRHSLLESEQKAPRRSRSALKRISRDIDQLDEIKKRQPGRYDLANEQWKVKTQIEITIAKYAKREDDDQLKQRLKPLVEQMLTIRKSILEFDRQTVTERLVRIDKQLVNLESNRDRAIDFRLRLLQSSIDGMRGKLKVQPMDSQTTPEKVRVRSAVTPEP